MIRIWTFLAASRRVMLRTSIISHTLSRSPWWHPWLLRADVVISTSPPLFCGLAGYAVSRIKRARWVLEVWDLGSEAIRAVGAIRNRWLSRSHFSKVMGKPVVYDVP